MDLLYIAIGSPGRVNQHVKIRVKLVRVGVLRTFSHRYLLGR